LKTVRRANPVSGVRIPPLPPIEPHLALGSEIGALRAKTFERPQKRGEAGEGYTRTPFRLVLTAYGDIFLLVTGHAAVELQAVRFEHPFDPATGRRLLSLLYSEGRL